MTNEQIKRAKDIVSEYQSEGLSTKQVKEKRQLYGENTLKRDKTSIVKILFKQFLNPFSLILTFAAGLSLYMQEPPIVLIIIILLNGFLGFIQEYRSCKAVEKLSNMIERSVSVLRENEIIQINTRELVSGDIVQLNCGNIVPADIRIINSLRLTVNEASLTGESTPVIKNSQSETLEETLLFTGSIIEQGQCTGIVYATGDNSQLGTINKLSRTTTKESPYQKSLRNFTYSMLKLISATIILVLVMKSRSIHSANEFADLLLFTIALAMTVIPEALPVITTLTLSTGSIKLAKQNVITKRLSAIEDLGRVDILCTDKTGTLTQNQLEVCQIISDEQETFQRFAYATAKHGIDNHQYVDAFDCALNQYIPLNIKKQTRTLDTILTMPFEPNLRRRRVILHDNNNQKYYLSVIGAPETLLDLSEITNNDYYNSQIKLAGKNGERQLAIAYKEIIYDESFNIDQIENKLTFLGFANFSDPLRDTAQETIETAKDLGIQIKILTGDSIEVASYIGQQLNIIDDQTKVYTGSELECMDEQDYKKVIEENAIFARVNPEQKYKIIQVLKENHVVGYQGDGINDAPSLKLANVSIAVPNATEVAKESADIVLLKDDLCVLIDGIRYGRGIYVNINKYIKHAMIGNLGNFFSMIFFYLVFAADIPMLAIQLLIGNIIQDLPLMTVFSDHVEESDLRKPHISTQVKPVVRTSLLLGAFTAIYYLLFFLITGTTATPLTQATLFLFYNFTQLTIVLSIRNNNFLWKGLKPSKLLVSTIVFFLIVTIALVYCPFTSNYLGFAPLSLKKFLVVIGCSILYIALLDCIKILLNKINSKKKNEYTFN